MPPSASPRLLIATATSLALLVGAGGCKPEKPDVLQARRAEAQERAESVREAVAQSGSGAAVKAASANLPADQAQLEVARVGDVVITLGDVAARIASQPAHMQTRYAAPEPRLKLLQDMVHLEVLVLEAQKQGLATNPRVQFAWKEAMARELLEARTKAAGTMHTISDAAVAAHYEQHKQDHFRPERRRAALLLVGSKAGAEKLLGQLRQAIGEAPRRAPQIFGDFAAEHSLDPLTRVVKGDLGWFDAQGTPDERRPKPPAEVVAPTFALEAVNAVSEPFPVGQRWALVQMTNRHAARQAPLEEVALDIRNELFRAQRTSAREAYIDQLVNAAAVTIDEAALAKLETPKPAKGEGEGKGKAGATTVRRTAPLPLIKRGAAARSRPQTIRAPERLSPEAKMQGEALLEKVQEGKEREKKRAEERERQRAGEPAGGADGAGGTP